MRDMVLRKFPYPYQAMLAICSDLDETPDSRTYLEIARFLNTREETSIGNGVGLEVGNTIYFDMPNDQFAYWNTDDAGRAMVRNLIRSGHIDCFHSFGDLASTREHARRALEELQRHDCRIECWIDHAAVPSNFGADIMRGNGDVPGSDAYHADLSYDHGVRFVWRGRVSSVIGQDVRTSLGGLASTLHPLASARTLATEAAKIVLARRGNTKYAMHASNDLIRPSTLRDGHKVFEFMRCNPYWGGVSGAATAKGMANVLTAQFLRRLVDRQATCILYTHLGKVHSPGIIFGERTVAAFRSLADRVRSGEILVTTTRRLLGYRLHSTLVKCEVHDDLSGERILIDSARCKASGVPVELSGLTVYVTNADTARVILDDQELADVARNPPDATGRPSVSIPWRPLGFPL